jgi:hypothetical protein
MARIASANRIRSTKAVRLVATSPAVPAWSACDASVVMRRTAAPGNTITSLWRLSLARGATERAEIIAYIVLAVGSAASLLNGFWRLDDFLMRWPSFVDLVRRVFS